MIATIVGVEAWLQEKLSEILVKEDLPGTVATIPGLPSKGQSELESALKSIFATLPAIGTYIPSGSYSDPEPDHFFEVDTVWVLCAASNSRTPGASLRGDQSSLGAWDLVTRVVRQLSGLGSEANIESCLPRRWDLLWCNSQVAVCSIQVDITIRLPLPLIDRPEGWAGNSY